MTQKTPQTIYLKDYRVPDFLIDAVELDFDLQQDKTIVSSVLHCQRNPEGEDNAEDNADVPLVLNGEKMQLRSIQCDGQSLDQSQYVVDEETLTISNLPDRFTLAIQVEIDPAANKALMGLYMSKGNYCTQCEPHGFRRITYFMDRPDVMTRFTTTIHADHARYPVLLSNGNLVGEGEEAGGRCWVKWEDPSLKPCYLFALVAGDYEHLADTFTTLSGRSVALRMYVEKGKKDQAAFALAALKRAMAWDEQAYGRAYDLDIYMVVAVSDFNFGAMENKGLNIFNSKYILANPKVATDKDYMNVERVIGHEYFHNWSGNRITCRDWFQITLKEGLTVFREQGFGADMTSPIMERIQSARIILTHQFAEDAGPTSHPIQPKSYMEVNNFYTTTVYNKGAEVIRMLHTLLGHEAFRRGMDLYFSRHDGQAVTTEDFVKAHEDANGADLSQFRHWYNQAGTPTVHVTSEYDADQQVYRLTAKQSGASEEAPAFLIPLSVGLLNDQGEDMALQLTDDTAPGKEGTRVLTLSEAESVFEFLNVPVRPVVSLARNFSAPVHVKYSYNDDELVFLMQHDSDLFNRWRAKDRLLTKHLEKLVKAAQAGSELHCDQRIVEVFEQLLKDESQDGSFLAEMLALPSEAYLVEVAEVADPVAIHQAREFMKRRLATNLFDAFWARYQACSQSKTDYVYDASGVARRAAQNLCLSYLLPLDKAEVTEQALRQFNNADNMTDVLAALSALTQLPGEACQQALKAFYDTWSDEDLVLDSWFMLQACADWPDILDHVKSLMDDPKYDPKNPNRVRSLVGAFASGNLSNFHDKSGAGYQFLASQVLEVDSFNPNLAARLAEPLLRWRKFDETRQERMCAQLRRIAENKSLSRNVYEIVSKGLG